MDICRSNACPRSFDLVVRYFLTVNNGTDDLMNLAIPRIATGAPSTQCSGQVTPYGLEGTTSSNWPYRGRGSEKRPAEATKIMSVSKIRIQPSLAGQIYLFHMTIDVLERYRRNGEKEVVDKKDWTIEWELQNEVWNVLRKTVRYATA